MSQVNERIRNEYEGLATLSDGERLTLVVNLWPSLTYLAQETIIRIATCIVRLDLPEPDSELAVVLSRWVGLSSADRKALARVAGL